MTRPVPAPTARDGAPGLPGDVQRRLGAHLAQLYRPCADAAPPEAFLALIARLTEVLEARDHGATRHFREGLQEALPHLRAFAISLTRQHDAADDLVQETMLKALRHHDKFEAGTNLQGWLFTILRNLFYSTARRHRREVPDPEGVFAGRVAVLPEQQARLDHEDLLAALSRLPAGQREVLMLVGAQGVSYEAAAAICGVPLGTIKSRVNRARARLADLMGGASATEYGPDGVTLAAIEPSPATLPG